MDYIITIQEVRDNTLIDSSTKPEQLDIMIIQAQKKYLRELLGIKLYNQITLASRNKNPSTIQRELIDDYIKDYLYAVVEMLSIYSLFVRIGDAGVNMPVPANSQSLTKEQLSALRIAKEGNVNYYGGLVKSFLEENISSFPLYNETNTILDAKKVNTWGFYIDPDIQAQDDLYYNRLSNNGNEESI